MSHAPQGVARRKVPSRVAPPTFGGTLGRKQSDVNNLGLKAGVSPLETILNNKPVLESASELTRSSRFRVTPNTGRVLFVYGRDEAEARSRLPAPLTNAHLEPAGYVENGKVHIPAEENSAVMESICGRDAPAKAK